MVVFTDTAKVSPQVVWNTCLAPMRWESWDPDIQGLLDVPDAGCQTGAQFTFHMNDGAKYPAVLTKVVQNESLLYTAKLLGGTVVIESSIQLQNLSGSSNNDDNNPATRITYSFELKGLLGGLTGALKSKMITEGTKHGLQNMIRLSEEAAGVKREGATGTCGATAKDTK
ncbi:hypothetical protein ACA910_006806 [Epithemia clementina (nom. ined.)]